MNRIVRTIDLTRNTLLAVFAGVLLALLPATASATDVRLVSYVSYAYQGNFADLATDGVQNFDLINQSSSPASRIVGVLRHPIVSGAKRSAPGIL